MIEIVAMEDGAFMQADEASTAISYYLLFANHDAGDTTTTTTTTTHSNNDTVETEDRVCYGDASHTAARTATASFWEEDDWTPEDEAEAIRILQESRARCSILTRNGSLQSTTSRVEKEDEFAWNRFYSRHQTNFFKDRHYLPKAFPQEFATASTSTSATPVKKIERTLVEIGCGVGNAMLPLLEEDSDDTVGVRWTVHGLDLSKVAIDYLQQEERFRQAVRHGRAHAHVCDISATIIMSSLQPQSSQQSSLPHSCQGVADVTTLLFCLSAIAPGPLQIQAARNVARTLKPNGGGVLVVRDYGRFDEAQMKLGTSRNKQLQQHGDNFYRKQDGTKCYYFTLDDIRTLFEKEAGLTTLELQYLRRAYRNRSTNEVRRRVWVQARFRNDK
jgi:methyltransferase-like protein 6